MLPTPHASTLVEPLRQALEPLRTATQQQVVFDPATSSRRFRISMTDISHLQFLPALMQRVGKVAPGVHIEMLRITAETPKLLEAGESDLAVGFMPELEAGFYQQKLFDQGFACVVRKNHPRIEARMTLNLYKRERRVAITAVGSGHDQVESGLRPRHEGIVALYGKPSRQGRDVGVHLFCGGSSVRASCAVAIAEIAQKHDVHPNQVTEWRRQLMERAAGVFGAAVAPESPPVDLKALHAKIGQLTLENDFLVGALGKAGLLSVKR